MTQRELTQELASFMRNAQGWDAEAAANWARNTAAQALAGDEASQEAISFICADEVTE